MCCEGNSSDAMNRQELTDYILAIYSIEPDYPFPMDDVSCVFRHIENRKWFALVMNVPYKTLGMDMDGAVDIVNVKCDPLLIGSLRGKPGFLPAYHMNKDKWMTVLLDETAGRDEIEMLLDVSYGLTKR